MLAVAMGIPTPFRQQACKRETARLMKQYINIGGIMQDEGTRFRNW